MKKRIRLKKDLTGKAQKARKQSRPDPGMLLLVSYPVIIVFILLLGKIAFATPGKSPVHQSMNKWDDIRQGTLMVSPDSEPGNYQSALLLSTKVDMKINGIVARTVVKQTFSNNSNNWIEGVYIFPLPDESAVDHLRMKVGDRIIIGEIKKKNKARKIYTAAKKQGKKATLLEQERPNIFTTSVANIGPHEKIEVEIEYQQLVRYVDSTFSIRFPMVVGTRYIPGDPVNEKTASVLNVNGSGWAVNTDQVPDAGRITPPVSHPDLGKINPVELTIHLDPGFKVGSIKSLYHGIDSTKDEDHQTYSIQFNNKVWADRDFVLEWVPADQKSIQAALFSEIRNEKAHYLLMVMPPSTSSSARALPRELVFVLDSSGSMGGASLRQAKEALKLAISRMTSQDRFNVIEFNNKADKLFDDPKQVSSESINMAISYIDKLQARGGTEMSSALRMALNGDHKTDRIRQVIFLTDGCVGNEEALFSLISNRLGDSRLFTIGIGSAPNSYFMTRSAQIGRGTFTYIGKVSEIQDKMTLLFEKLENPVFTNVQLLADGKPVTGYPDPIPDLYMGEPLTFSTRLDEIPDKFTLRGMTGAEPWSITLKGTAKSSAAGIATHWARQKIRFLMDSMALGADKEKVRQDIINTALANHLVSRYTSLVAVEQKISRPETQGLNKTSVPTNLPHGWEHDKVFGGRAKTATASNLLIVSGILLLIISLLLYVRLRKNECAEVSK